MGQRTPFILLDDARREGGAPAHLFENPKEIFVATRGEEVADVLERSDAARRSSGGRLAGYIAYEAGLALEPKLAPLVDARGGSMGPLVWLGLFENEQEIAAEDVPQWLASQADGPGTLGPMEPQLSTGGYTKAFARLQEAIHAGDIYQVNLTYQLAGAYRGDPVALWWGLAAVAHGDVANPVEIALDGSRGLTVHEYPGLPDLQGGAERLRVANDALAFPGTVDDDSQDDEEYDGRGQGVAQQ